MTDDANPAEITYAWASGSAVDTERLARVAGVFAAPTERLLARAGIGPGSNVLELGCGSGEVTAILSRIVGPGGSVVAIDRDQAAVDATRRRTADLGATNVEIERSDIGAFERLDAFDAAFGRLVLMYQPDPTAIVRHVAKSVRPGGVVAFLEMSHPPIEAITEGWERLAWPPTPLRRTVGSWVQRALMLSGTQPLMGLRLPQTFADAGLVPSMEIEPVAAVMPSTARSLTDAARSALGALVSTGVASSEEIDIDTLEERLAAEQDPYSLSLVGVGVGAWATKP